MKKDVHPKYQKVLFVDSASGYKFVCGSTLQPSAKEVFEGVEYPVSYLSISSASHPFFTGSKQLVDSEGRVEKFKKRFDKKGAASQDNGQQKQEQQQQPKAQAAAPKKGVEKSAEKKVEKKAASKPAEKTADKKPAEKPAKAKK